MTGLPAPTLYHRWLGWHAPAMRRAVTEPFILILERLGARADEVRRGGLEDTRPSGQGLPGQPHPVVGLVGFVADYRRRAGQADAFPGQARLRGQETPRAGWPGCLWRSLLWERPAATLV
jgi:hypothetical protein